VTNHIPLGSSPESSAVGAPVSRQAGRAGGHGRDGPRRRVVPVPKGEEPYTAEQVGLGVRNGGCAAAPPFAG
jgi:hypothetical protein